MTRSIFFILLFFLSGIAGLIYESIWTHYLKLFLGHAAYSQTLVMAIYMGGMAIGAWIAGIKLPHISKPLEKYALIEIILGIAALFFHAAFLLYQNFSYDSVLPFLGSRTPVILYKWLSAAFLILPQSMLLGATFPLMAAGFIRLFPGASGRNISVLYFANTLGASAGVLLSGFFLVEKAGLAGTIMTAGIIDLCVGFGVLILCRYNNQPYPDDIPNAQPCPEHTPLTAIPDTSACNKALMIIAGLTAASSFMYELGWIRMLSLVLGSSTHSFELMLSTFILGIALGSFLIRNRIDAIVNIPRAIVLAQVIMGIGALFSVIMYGKMFHVMQFIMAGLEKSTQGYFFYNLFCDMICMLVMLPSTICAGMVLPLIIHYFYKNGSGEKHIGTVYSINTFGGIAGIAVSVWLLMPLIGVRLLITNGGILDIAIGIFVLYYFKETKLCSLRQYLPALSLLSIAISIIFGRTDPALAASGVFRNGTISGNIHILSHEDGRTATISLYRSSNNLVLATNGKPDAGINVNGGICGDEYTMALCGALPLAIADTGANAAIIGLGSGMTAHYLLCDPALAHLDIIEIEPAMAEAARGIGEKVENAFDDNRSKIHIDDAKSFFSTVNQTYDIIISEPSNPWVSGVSGLFSVEFFERIRHHLTDDGILVQWFHRYESDISIISSIIGALRCQFPRYQLFSVGSDCILVASKNPSGSLDFSRDLFTVAPLARQLNSLHFSSMDDLVHLRMATEKTMDRLVSIYPAPPNSDYAPFIDLNAVKYRYLDDNIKQFDTLYRYIVPVRKILEKDTAFINLSVRDTYPDLTNFNRIAEAKNIFHDIVGVTSNYDGRGDSAIADVSTSALLLDYATHSPANIHFDVFFRLIIDIFEKTLPFLSAAEMRTLWDAIETSAGAMTFTDNDQSWMNYFAALASYDFPVLKEVSAELLPATGTIEDDYVNRMLLTSLMIASSRLGDTRAAYEYFSRFEAKRSPGIMISLCMDAMKH